MFGTPGLYDAILLMCTEDRCALVLPAFEHSDVGALAEIDGSGGMRVFPRCVCDDSVRGVCESAGMVPFASSVFPPGHRATEYQKWERVARGRPGNASEWYYPVEYEEGYEPFVIAFRGYVPWYDERFRVRGVVVFSRRLALNDLARAMGRTK